MAHAVAVRFDAFHQAFGLQRFHHRLAAGEAVHALEPAGRFGHGAVVGDDLDAGQVVAAPDFKVVGVVGRGHFQRSGAGGEIHVAVADDGDLPVHQRQHDGRRRQAGVAFIIRVDGHGRVAQHGLRARGGHGQRSAAVGEGIADVVEVAVYILVLHLKVGEGRVTAAAPVDDVVSLVNQPLFEKLHEHFAHGARQPFVHGEAFTVPVARRPQALELVDDGAAVLLTPAPDGLDEFLASQLMPVGALGRQLLLDHVLGGDAGMVRARHPQDAVPLEAAVAAHDVLHGIVEGMAHVKHTGDIGRRDDDREGALGGRLLGSEQLLLLPIGIPSFFNLFGRIALVQQITAHGLAAPCGSGPVA